MSHYLGIGPLYSFDSDGGIREEWIINPNLRRIRIAWLLKPPRVYKYTVIFSAKQVRLGLTAARDWHFAIYFFVGLLFFFLICFVNVNKHKLLKYYLRRFFTVNNTLSLKVLPNIRSDRNPSLETIRYDTYAAVKTPFGVLPYWLLKRIICIHEASPIKVL